MIECHFMLPNYENLLYLYPGFFNFALSYGPGLTDLLNVLIYMFLYFEQLYFPIYFSIVLSSFKN